MPERSRRSADEREAARLDRARKRAQQSGGKAPAESPSAPPAADLQPAREAQPAGAYHQEVSPPPPAQLDREPQAPETGEEFPETGEGFSETGEEFSETGEHELPSGTRRISRRETPLVVRAGRTPKRRRTRPLRPRSPRRLWIGRIFSVVAIVVAAAGIWFLIQLFQPFQGSAHGRLTVTIPERSSSSQVGKLLQRDGVIASSFFFELRATLAGQRGALHAGTFHLQMGMSYGDVLTALTKAPPGAKVTQLTITEGRTRQEISSLLRKQHVAGSYLAVTRSSKLLNLRSYGIQRDPSSLEGFLFPDTYQLVDPIKVSALADDQLRTFKQQFAKVGLGYARRNHLTPYDVLKIASLIEAEAADQRERPLIASVIYNRLAVGMMLQFDSTTRYATGNFTQPLTVSELHSGSPFNTRTHLGLPPTPIDNPGLASIQAAAHPAQTRYLFFFARPCGRGSVFASDYAQFLALGHRYQSQHC